MPTPAIFSHRACRTPCPGMERRDDAETLEHGGGSWFAQRSGVWTAR